MATGDKCGRCGDTRPFGTCITEYHDRAHRAQPDCKEWRRQVLDTEFLPSTTGPIHAESVHVDDVLDRGVPLHLTVPEPMILKGDSRLWLPALAEPVHCVITDPPYGVDFVSRRAETAAGKKWVRPIAGDKSLQGAIDLFLEVMEPLVPKLAPEADLYIFTRWDIVDTWINVVKAIDPDIHYKMMLVWDKGIPGMGDIDANWGCGHEIILYFKKGRRDVAYRRSSIIAVDKVHASQLIHPHEKPVALMEYFVTMSTSPGDLIVDPFSGSGASIVAAQRNGRRGLGIELDSDHVRRSRLRLDQPVMEF